MPRHDRPFGQHSPAPVSYTHLDWGLDRIQSGKSLSYNIGAGGDVSHDWGKFEDKKYQVINKASGSFSAGFGLVTSESEEEYNLIDINSDGLPDKVWKLSLIHI